MKYESKVTEWGEEALLFLEDKNLNFVILFNDDAPEELKEVAVLHTASKLKAPLVVGDTLEFGKKKFQITAIGEEAKYTFTELGHCTLCFSGDDKPHMPGYITVQGPDSFTADDVFIGCEIKIY